MADEDELEAGIKPKRNLLLIGLVAVNMLGMAGVGAYVMFFQSSPSPASADDAAPAPPPEERFGPMFELNPIVANLANQEGTRYVKVKLHFEVANDEDLGSIEALMVPLRDRMLIYFSGLTVEGSIGDAQKDVIRAELVTLANELIGRELVRNIYFTEFVVQ